MFRLRQSNNGVVIFLIYAIFIFFSALIVVIGGRVYSQVYNTSQKNEKIRSVVSYVTNKVRSGKGEVYVKDKDGKSVLVIEGEGEFETLIYEDNGVLRELINEKGEDFKKGLGEEITYIDTFNVSMSDNKLLEIQSKINKDEEIKIVHIDTKV